MIYKPTKNPSSNHCQIFSRSRKNSQTPQNNLALTERVQPRTSRFNGRGCTRAIFRVRCPKNRPRRPLRANFGISRTTESISVCSRQQLFVHQNPQREDFPKNIEKPLDKQKNICYNNKVNRRKRITPFSRKDRGIYIHKEVQINGKA